MKWKVLVTAPYLQPVIERFRPELEARGVELVIPQVRERLEQGQQTGDGNGEPAVLALRMAGLDALPEYADRPLEGVLSGHACSS